MMQILKRSVVVVVAVILGSGSEGRGQEAPQVPPVAADEPRIEHHLRLEAPAGFETQALYVQAMRARSDDAAAQARQATEPAVSADLWLTAANLILSHEIERTCTVRLLPAEPADGSGESDETAASLDRCDAMLAEARALITAQAGDAEQAERGWEALRARLETMEAFSAGLRGYLLGDQALEGGEQEARRAASRLAVLLEARDPRVAAAAALWYAALRSGEEDPAPALAALPQPLGSVRPETIRYGFFARLLRCRLVAERGGEAAALALLMQMEERCLEWFRDEHEQASSVRAILAMESQVLTAWRNRLSSQQKTTEAQWCTERIDAVRASITADDGTVMRLGSAVPMLGGPEDTTMQRPAPSHKDE